MNWKNIDNVTRSGLELTVTTSEPHGLSTGDPVRFDAAGGLWALEGWTHFVTIGAPPAGLGIVEVTYDAGTDVTSVRHASYNDPVLKKVRFGPVVIDGVTYPDVTGWSNYGYLKLSGDLTATITTSSTVWTFTAEDGPHTFVPAVDPTTVEFTITLPSPVYIADYLGGGMVACPWVEPTCEEQSGRFWPINKLETATLTGYGVGQLVPDNLKSWNRGLVWRGVGHTTIFATWPDDDVAVDMVALADCNCAVRVRGDYAGHEVFDMFVEKAETLYGGGELPGVETVTGTTGDRTLDAQYTMIDLHGTHIIDKLHVWFGDDDPTASVLFVGTAYRAEHAQSMVLSKPNIVGTTIQTSVGGVDHIGPRHEARQWTLNYSLAGAGDASAADRWIRTGQQMLIRASNTDSVAENRMVTAMVTVLKSAAIVRQQGGFNYSVQVKEAKVG